MTMNDRTLVKVSAGEHCICFRTVSRERRSPNRFYVLRSELAKLETQASVISHDIWSFAVMRRDAAADTLEIQFTWLNGSGTRRSGWEETVTLPYTQLAAFVEDSAQEGGPREWKALSIDTSRRRPKFVFNSQKALHAILANGVVRRKLVRFLRDNFRWPSSEQIHFYSDFVPYSFTFQDVRNGRASMTGGLILHGQEDMGKAYYSIHT